MNTNENETADERNADQELEALLAFIRDSRGFDFTGYKRTTLSRRIHKRMRDIDAPTWSDYRDRLEIAPEEFSLLFNTVLINVTSFFRDVEAWRYLQQEVVPEIVANSAPDGEIRIWSAGCSSGEEPYSLAIVMAEALGVQEAIERVKIYATDIDDDALRVARAGSYPVKELSHLPQELRERYFEVSGSDATFRADLRRRVIFGRHDIVQDAPISRLDLLLCRNTLMYFNGETQRQIVERLHFALKEGGFLFLGKAEILLADGERFEAASMRNRIFRRRPGRATPPRAIPQIEVGSKRESKASRARRQLREQLIDESPFPAIALDADDMIVAASREARNRLNIGPQDLGHPFRDHPLSHRPAEVWAVLEETKNDRSVVRRRAVAFPDGTDERFYDIIAQPLSDDLGRYLGTSLSFLDVTAQTRLERQVKEVRNDLETALEELQSTNEELETTNEELQSSNEELETMNEELRIRSEELGDARSFLDGVLASIGAGVVVLDEESRVKGWNRMAEELWGVRADETQDKAFADLDIGLPVDLLTEAINRCMGESRRIGPIEVPAVNRRGRAIVCLVTCAPLETPRRGCVLMMDLADGSKIAE